MTWIPKGTYSRGLRAVLGTADSSHDCVLSPWRSCAAILREAEALPAARGGWRLEDGIRHLLATDAERWAPIFNTHGIPAMLRNETSGCHMTDQEAALEAPFHSLLQTIV